MPKRRVVHTITPGDHFSPRTGSAIPTVVHGFASAAKATGDPRHAVVIDGSTWKPRYDSAEAIEYVGTRPPRREDRLRDSVRGLVGLPRVATAGYYRPIADAVRDLEPSIVLAHNAPVLPWLLRGSPHQVVLYAHNELLRTYSKAETSRMLDEVAAIVCVSASLAEATARKLPRRLADRIHVVHNGVDVGRFTPREVPPSADGPVRIVFVGRVVPEKGVDVLLEAARLVTTPDVEYTIVGSSGFAREAPLSEYEQRLRALAVEAGVPVHFESFVARDALPPFLRDAGILVIPSRWPDPCPLTVGEGLATGLPIVASRIGGIPEIVAPTTRLVEADSPSALAAQLDALASDHRLRAKLARDARAWAEAHDWAWAWGRLANLLDTL